MLGIQWRIIYHPGTEEAERIRLTYTEKSKTYVGEVKPSERGFLCTLSTYVFMGNRPILQKTKTFEEETEEMAKEKIETLIVNTIH